MPLGPFLVLSYWIGEGKVINKEMTRPSDSETEETLNALEGI